MLSFKGSSFDGTNVTPEGDFASNARDARAFVDNVALYEGELSVADVAQLFNNGNNSLSVKEQKINSLKIYPNPVKDIFNVSYSSEISSVRVMNLLGQEVISTAVNATSTQIDMSQLSSGAYIVNVTVGDTIKTIKVVKQ